MTRTVCATNQRFACPGPKAIATDELPNVPHLDLETMGNFAKAKIKEAILEVTGG